MLSTKYNIKRLIYSQSTYTATRMALGIVLPAIILIIGFKAPALALATSIGALCVSLIDLSIAFEKLKYRHMLITTLIIATVLFIMQITHPHSLLFWGACLVITFLSSLAIANSMTTLTMGIAAMAAMMMALDQTHHLEKLPIFFVCLILGGLWYSHFRFLICALFREELARRSLAECLYATADYFKARSLFYRPYISLNECYTQIIHTQAILMNQQQTMMDWVLSHMFRRKKILDDPSKMVFFNMMIDLVNMHDFILAMQVDFDALRKTLHGSDSLDFLFDILNKTGDALQNIAESVVFKQPMLSHFNVKAELRALEHEIKLSQERHANNEIYFLESSFQRVSSIAKMTQKLIEDLTSVKNTTSIILSNLQKVYSPFFTRAPFIAWPTPIALRYAIRFTAAIALGMAISQHMAGHSIWVIITIMMVLRPGFGITQQRNKQRIYGTILGCISALICILFIHQVSSFLLIISFSLVLTFMFFQSNYFISTTFFTIFLLLSYHFTSPETAIIQQRFIDTLIGASIGMLGSYILPTWEKQFIPSQIKGLLLACRELNKQAFSRSRDESMYYLVKHKALLLLAQLSLTYQRMQQEPIDKQIDPMTMKMFIIEIHAFISQLILFVQYQVNEGHNQANETPLFKIIASNIEKALAGETIQKTTSTNEINTASTILFELEKSAINMLRLQAKLNLKNAVEEV